MAMAPTTKATTTFGSVQPSAGPSMMPNSRPPRPMIDSTAPSGSRSPWLGSFDFGIMKTPATRAIRAIGTLTQNTELHEKWSSSRPPVTGPIATPSPEKPAQTAIARPRSRGSRKTLARIDSVEGMISAPPMPMNARLRISCIVESTAPPTPSRAMKTSSPVCRAPLRP